VTSSKRHLPLHWLWVDNCIFGHCHCKEAVAHLTCIVSHGQNTPNLASSQCTQRQEADKFVIPLDLTRAPDPQCAIPNSKSTGRLAYYVSCIFGKFDGKNGPGRQRNHFGEEWLDPTASETTRACLDQRLIAIRSQGILRDNVRSKIWVIAIN